MSENTHKSGEPRDHGHGLSHDLPQIVRRGLLALFGGVGAAAIVVGTAKRGDVSVRESRPKKPRLVSRITATLVARRTRAERPSKGHPV